MAEPWLGWEVGLQLTRAPKRGVGQRERSAQMHKCEKLEPRRGKSGKVVRKPGGARGWNWGARPARPGTDPLD